MLGAVFMATDYVTSPMSNKGMLVYGIGIGVLTVLIRRFGAYPEGVQFAISSTALMKGRVPDTPLTRSILNSHHPKRSGDIFIVFESHWFINDFDGLSVASTHGSPWRYDTYVPIIFAGANLKSQKVYREVQTVDVASTLAGFVGTNLPSGARGEILQEVVRGHDKDDPN